MKYRDITDKRYMTLSTVALETDVRGYNISADRYRLYPDGLLIVRPYYVWDGASGPVVQTSDSVKATLGHDVLYELMRLGSLPQSAKDDADRFLYTQLIRDGMNPVRALIWYRAVEAFGHANCRPGTQDDKIREIP